MPELPEVETIKRQLSRKIKGKKIKDVEVRLPKLVKYPLEKFKKLVKGAKIVGLRRRGKLVFIELSSGYFLVIHLKLSGQLIFNSGEGKHTHVIYHFTDGSHLIHNDLRRFGFIKVVPKDELDNFIQAQRLGPEPLEKSFTLKKFKELLAKRKKSKIKLILMDQSFLVGVGNIYANEILFSAGVLPTREVGKLTSQEIQKIYQGIKRILTLAIQKKGSSDRDYVDASGKKGRYMELIKVYRREGEACLKCNTKVKRLKMGSRSAYFCPKCQK